LADSIGKLPDDFNEGGSMELSKEIRLSRRALYDRVWKKPLQEVARELGLSDVGLAKMCRRSGIPLPPRGFHLMAAGPAKERLVVGLPPGQDNEAPRLSFRVPEADVLEAQSRAKKQLVELSARSPSKSSTEVRRTVEARLATIRRAVDRRRIDDRGVIVTPSVDFAIRVSPAMFDRAINIMMGLSERVLKLGGAFSSGDKWRKDRLCLQWEGYEFAFKIEESSSRQPIPAGKRVPKTYSRYRGDDWYLAPTGKLALEGRGPGYEVLSLRDGKEMIEERLEELLERMYQVVVGQREVDRIKAVREERAIAYLRRQDSQRQLEEFELRRRRQLQVEARQHRQAESLRHYIHHVELKEFCAGPTFPDREARDEWIHSIRLPLDELALNRRSLNPAKSLSIPLSSFASTLRRKPKRK
jgi:hypothetical protein